MSFLGRKKHRNLMSAACADLDDAYRRLSDLLLSSDTLYATQEPEWQEGPEGGRHCAASEKLRRALVTLQALDLPGVGDLG